jgi:NitT/TauT family transport system substrate-binding protein
MVYRGNLGRLGQFRRRLRPGLAALAFVWGGLGTGCRKDTATATGPDATGGATPLTKVVFQTNWTAQPEQGGYYQALARGFFREAGLDVTIAPGGPGAFPMQKVAVGQAQFGIGRSDDLILAAQQGLPLVIVCAQLEHDPQGITVHAESPVQRFEDLDGRTIKAVPGQAWLDFLKLRYKINFNVVPENYGYAQFIADPNFIQQGYLTTDAYYCGLQRVKVRVLLISDSGYDAYRVVFTSRDFITRHPGAVKAFVQASIRGWNDFIDGDSKPAETLLTKDNSENTPELMAYVRTALRAHGMVSGDPAKGEHTGLITRGRLTDQLNILRQLGLLKTPVSVDQVATFDFLPEELKAPAR